jgi:MoxR-like ATPase
MFIVNTVGCEYRKIKTNTGGFSLITIKGNSDNGEIFELFRKFGILTGNLTIGVAGTPSKPTLYTSAKMIKDISKFAPEIQAALVFTLFSIAKICTHVIVKTPKLEVNAASLRVACDIPLDDFIVSFTHTKTFEVKELPTDNYTEIVYYNNKYSVLESTCPKSVGYGVFAETDLDGNPSFKDAVIASAIVYGTTVYPVTMYPYGVIRTNMDLTSFEAAKDSYVTSLAALYHMPTVTVCCVPLADMVKSIGTNNNLVNIIEDQDLEDAFMSEAHKSLTDWNSCAKAFTRDSLEDEVCGKLTTAFGLKVVTSSGIMSCDEVRETYKDDVYAQQLYTQIKPYYDTYDLGTLSANLKGFVKGDLYSMLFAGDSGTGKSTAARVIPARCGIPYVSINFSVNIEEADIFGSMIPNTTKASADDPEFVWQDGVLTKAVRNGYCAVLEEINFARPGVLGKLNSLLDENRQIDLPTGEILKAHPNFRIIATCNVAYEGTNRFNKALINRFDDCTIFKDVARAKAIEIIKTRTGYKNMAKIDAIYNVYEALKKYGKEQNLNLIVSMRQLLNLFSKGKYYADAMDAVKRIMLNGAFIEEPEYQEEFESTVLVAFNLKFKI